MWPVSSQKWSLGRLDHSAIYLLIAATYTPFIAQMKSGTTTIGLLLGIWFVSIVGIIVKLTLPGRFDRFSIGLYLLLGWSGVIVHEKVVAALPSSTLWLIAHSAPERVLPEPRRKDMRGLIAEPGAGRESTATEVAGALAPPVPRQAEARAAHQRPPLDCSPLHPRGTAIDRRPKINPPASMPSP